MKINSTTKYPKIDIDDVNFGDIDLNGIHIQKGTLSVSIDTIKKLALLRKTVVYLEKDAVLKVRDFSYHDYKLQQYYHSDVISAENPNQVRIN